MAGPSASRVMNAHICRILLESDDNSGCINFGESSDSDVDCAQEENWNEADKVVQEDMDDDIVAHDSDTQWVWRVIQTSYRGQKVPLTGQCEPQKNVECVLEAFLLFLTSM
jgi:hypothetical protein